MFKQVFLCGVITVSLYAFDYDLYPKKVAKDTYCFFGKLENISKQNGGDMVNTCFIQTEVGFVVIDSGPTFSYASQAYTQMQKIAKLPVKYVITTHNHDDHWLGNSFYKQKGTLLIGPRSYEESITTDTPTRMERILGKTLFGKTTIVPLDTIVEENLTLNVGKKIFYITQPEPIAHTKGDLLVYLKNDKVLFTGDLVFSGRVTSLRDGSLLGSIDALNKIDAYHAKVIVSGHGYNTDTNATQQFKRYLVEMKEKILAAQDKDIGLESITKVVTMPKYRQMKLYDVLFKRTVVDAYKELEMMEDEE